MLLQTPKKQDFLQNLYFKYLAKDGRNPDLDPDPKLLRSGINNSGSGINSSGPGLNISGSGINSSGSTTLLHIRQHTEITGTIYSGYGINISGSTTLLYIHYI
jgi:hypothetical protein